MAWSSSLAAWPAVTVLPIRLTRIGDERLARLVSSGEEKAFAALYQRYHQPLYRYCRSILHDDDDAQDALQSTLTGALVALRRGHRDAPLRPWLFRIAHSEAISVLGRPRDSYELTDAAEQGAASADESVLERERVAQLLADLRELPDRVRSALLMRELSGLSHAEIASVLDTSVGTAKQSIFEARRGLLEFAQGRALACESVRRSISDGDGRVLRGRRVRAHLRDCPTCAAFAAAIPARRARLQALVPALAPAASAAMLAHVAGHGSGRGGGGAVAGATGKTLGGSVAAKTLTSAAVVITATTGVTGMTRLLTPAHGKGAAGTGHAVTSIFHSPAARHATAAVVPGTAHSTPRTHARVGRVARVGGGHRAPVHTVALGRQPTRVRRPSGPPGSGARVVSVTPPDRIDASVAPSVAVQADGALVGVSASDGGRQLAATIGASASASASAAGGGPAAGANASVDAGGGSAAGANVAAPGGGSASATTGVSVAGTDVSAAAAGSPAATNVSISR